MKPPTAMYKLSVTVNREKKQYPINLKTDTIGCFSRLSKLESLIKTASENLWMQPYYWKQIKFRIFEVEKFYLNELSTARGHWVYDAAGNRYGGYEVGIMAPFKGREAAKCLFKPGDIVEFMNGPELKIGVILDLPRNHASVQNYNGKLNKRYSFQGKRSVFVLDQSDDSYLVSTGLRKQDQAHPWVHHVFTPSYPITEEKNSLFWHLYMSYNPRIPDVSFVLP